MSRIDYKLCILAAGEGSRNTRYKNLHKALLPLGNRATIARIIEIVPESVPVVIAVGYMKEQIKDYLAYTYPNRDIEFIDVENYNGPGSGPGLSLFECRESLQCPFIFLGSDTLIDGAENDITPDRNWIGVGNSSAWCDEAEVYCLYEQGRGFYYESWAQSTAQLNNCFIGVAGIRDYKKFWSNLETPTLIKGEHQVLNGFTELDDLRSMEFKSWRDTGNNKSYRYTFGEYKNIVEPKPDEAIYIENKKVLKYFDDGEKVTNRVERGKQLLPNVPEVQKISDHIYGYNYLSAIRFSDIRDVGLFDQFFAFVKSMYLDNIQECDLEKFRNNCGKMYRGKTHSRVSSHPELKDLESVIKINGQHVKSINSMLESVDWDAIENKAVPVILHGDMSPENILYDTENDRFTLIDWRDKFGDDLYLGDLYYDLCKLDHGLLVNGEIVRGQNYLVEVNGNEAHVEISVRTNLIDARKSLYKFCNDNDLDFEHVKLLTALTLLNISSVHSDEKFNRFLFLYGKLLLKESLDVNRQLNSII